MAVTTRQRVLVLFFVRRFKEGRDQSQLFFKEVPTLSDSSMAVARPQQSITSIHLLDHLHNGHTLLGTIYQGIMNGRSRHGIKRNGHSLQKLTLSSKRLGKK